MVRLDLLCLGTGKASTHIYHGEPSTGFVLIQDGEPVLLFGAGLGIVRSCVHYCKKIPDTIYISHNHTDHAGELPLLLSVEAGKGRRKRVVAEPEVMTRILNHRLAEYHESINLSNRKLSDLAEFIDSPEQEHTHLSSHLSIVPVRSQHSERCFGFILYYMEAPILGWSADCGYDPQFYSTLAAAPVVVLDARQTGSYDHAGFDNIAEFERQLAASCDANGEQRVAVYVTSYGTQAEMPAVPQALRIGQTLVLYDDMGPPLPGVPAVPAYEQQGGPGGAGEYSGALTPRGGLPAQHHGGVSPRAAYDGGYAAAPPPQADGFGAHATPTHTAHPTPVHAPAQHPPRQPRSRSPTASPRPGVRRGGAGQERSNEIKNYLHSMNDTAQDPRSFQEGMEDPDADKSYGFSLPGQRGQAPYQIRRFPNPAPGPRKIFVFNNECKGAPARMFLIKSVRTLDQLKLKVADTLNIKPIRHLHRLDGVPVRTLDEIPHMAELVATKHAGAPFDVNDLPLHVKVGGHPEY